ncbi:hypothetical protein KDL01_20015 [Actinospica durhamensis]|uniref:Uncharacterized protein n=1 Tax=Actinospica durhamensis TaxID=1508375 RepID=A0A941IUH7_9ACTN|nr:hypothetical protein [Actinospica durhamensis]MBR7835571.1 hypothetical protein [Actinospica durhamensis]
MNGTLRLTVTIAASLLGLAACLGAAWLVTAWDLSTRVAVGTSAGVIVGAVIAVWGADRAKDQDHAAEVGGHQAGDPRKDGAASLAGGHDAPAPLSQQLSGTTGSIVVQSGGDVHFGSAQITVNPPPPAAAPGTITATVTAFHEDPPRGGWRMADAVRHEGSILGGRLTIRPAHPYLDLMRSGAVLTHLDRREMTGLRRARPAQLDIKLVNNTAETVFAHQVRLDVVRSVDRVQSVPFVRGASVTLVPQPDVGSPISFLPVQFGLPDFTLRFHLEAPGRPAALTSEYAWQDAYSPTSRAERHPLLRALDEAGARPVKDEERARRSYRSVVGREPDLEASPYGATPLFHDAVWDVGPFKDHRALMVGVVEYAEPILYEDGLNGGHRFAAPINLEVRYPRPPAVGAALHRSAEYQAPTLRRSGTDYTVEVPSHTSCRRERRTDCWYRCLRRRHPPTTSMSRCCAAAEAWTAETCTWKPGSTAASSGSQQSFGSLDLRESDVHQPPLILPEVRNSREQRSRDLGLVGLVESGHCQTRRPSFRLWTESELGRRATATICTLYYAPAST